MTLRQLIERGIISPFSPVTNCKHDWRGIDTGRMCFLCGEIEEQYQGTMVESMADLVARIDNTLALEKLRKEERNKMLCARCREPRGDHSPLWDGERCPNSEDGPNKPWYLPRKFRELRCQASINGERQCEKDCVPGMEMCKEHLGE